MPRSRATAILTISPSRVELATATSVRAGQVEAMALEPAMWQDAQGSAYRTLDSWLQRSADALGLRPGTPVRIAVTGTSLRGEIIQHPAGRRAATGLAYASMADQFDASGGLHHVATRPLPGRAEEGSKSVRSFVSAETDATLDALASLVERGGFRCSGVTSLASAHAAVVCREVASSGRTRIVCDVGKHESVIAVGGRGVVPLLRPFNIGVAALIDAYRRCVGDKGDDPNATMDRARELCYRHGVPGRGDVIDEALGLTGRDALPLLQPVIQRLAVEVKNTLRFGLRSTLTDSTRIEFTGQAPSVPGLIAAIAAHLEADSVQLAEASPSPADGGSYAALLLAAPPDPMPLRPLRLARRSARSRSRRVMLAGAVGAAAVLGLEAALVTGEIRREERARLSLRPRLEMVRGAQEQAGRAALIAEDLRLVRETIDERLGERARWSSALATLAGAITDRARLRECRGSTESGRAWLRLSGEIDLESPEDRALAALLDTLERNAFFDLVELESARVEQGAEGVRQRFAMRLRLVGEPFAPAPVIVAAPGEVEP
jgi:Tfp pilus assembly protein PilN